MVCWTCGTEVEKHQIENTLDQLRSFQSEKRDKRSSLQNEIDELEAEKHEYEENHQQREQLNRQLKETQSELTQREQKLDDLKDHRTNLNDRVEQLEAEVEKLETDEYSEILDLHKEANQCEFQLDRLKTQYEDIEDQIEETKTQISGREELQERRDEIQTDLEDLRTRIDRIEAESIEEFNTHMETVLDLLNYENIERIWIERTKTKVREGRRKIRKNVFDLHVVRSSASGSAYEDTIDHLSESEREVTGLVFALAGYLVHDVYEHCPFMLLDSVEALDSDRIATLVDYFKDYAEYLIVALLPEDADALNEEYQRITDI
jgi:DNA repair exonuclease SbcCD ATPase subunit